MAADAGDGDGVAGVPTGALTDLLRRVAASPEAPEVEATLPAGAIVGRFEVVREVGRGGFGVVYEARDRELGRTVALKFIRPGRASVEGAQVFREAETIARLAHPNLITLHDVGRSEGGPFLVFEFLHGKTLQERLGEGPLPVVEAVHVAAEVARGLAHAHAEGVVHRDLKPSNVFLTGRGQVKILDFGLAHAFGRRRVSGGTPAYMAPEQWADDPEDERTDVFALGVMLHRMLSGEYPFPEGEGRWSADAAGPARLQIPGTPGLAELVERMLARSPRERPRDGAAVLAALLSIEEALRARPATGAPPVQATRRRATLGDLVAELKRRRVFRVMLGYGIFAFAVLQVIEPVMHGAHLPDWTLSATLVALGLGVPVALILAWLYDLTESGVRRTPTGSGPRAVSLSRGRLAGLLLGAGLVAAAAGGGWLRWHGPAAPGPAALDAGSQGAGPQSAAAAGAAAEGPSVAVLPFLNLSSDPEQEFFSDGLSEEILNRLAQIPGLRVPARTSSFAFKGQAMDVRKMATALQVGALLEGSVRRAGGRIRITAQLVKAVDGFHLWSQTFDREPKDVFAVQDEIAASIASALRIRLVEPGGGAAQAGGTSNPEAYEAYLLGQHQLNQRNRKSIAAAAGHYEKALALDPTFAAAYARLAIATLLRAPGWDYAELKERDVLERARPLVAKAQALAPDRPEVLSAAGVLATTVGDNARALEYFDRAIAMSPSDGELLNWRRNSLSLLGRLDQALDAAAAAVKADPLSRVALFNYAWMLAGYGREEEARRIAERLGSVDEPWGHAAVAAVAAYRGEWAGAARHRLLAWQGGRSESGLTWVLTRVGLGEEALRVGGSTADVYGLLLLGKQAEALAMARLSDRERPTDRSVQGDLFEALYATKAMAEAGALAAEHWASWQQEPGTFQPEQLLRMADAVRATGRAELAAKVAAAAHGLALQYQKLGLTEAWMDEYWAHLAAYERRDEDAMTFLSKAAPTLLYGTFEMESPLFSRLFSRPDYLALVKQVDAKRAVERAKVAAVLCDPKMATATWKPLPATCAQAQTPK